MPLRATPIPLRMVLVMVFSSEMMSLTPARATGANTTARTNDTMRACFLESLSIISILLEELHLMSLPATHPCRPILAVILPRVPDKPRSTARRHVAITTKRGTCVHVGRSSRSSTRLLWERDESCGSSLLFHRSPAGHLQIGLCVE